MEYGSDGTAGMTSVRPSEGCVRKDPRPRVYREMVESDEEVGSSLQGDNIHLIDGDNGVGEIKSRSLDELRKIKTKWRDDLKVLRDSKAQWLAKGKGIMSSPGVCDNSTVG